MDAAFRIVTQLPLSELWNSTGTLSAVKRRSIGCGEIAEALRHGSVRFVVADCGKPLQWIPLSDCYTFWKTEAKPRVAQPNLSSFRFEDFPGEYCYAASAWEDGQAQAIVLLEMFH